MDLGVHSKYLMTTKDPFWKVQKTGESPQRASFRSLYSEKGIVK